MQMLIRLLPLPFDICCKCAPSLELLARSCLLALVAILGHSCFKPIRVLPRWRINNTGHILLLKPPPSAFQPQNTKPCRTDVVANTVFIGQRTWISHKNNFYKYFCLAQIQVAKLSAMGKLGCYFYHASLLDKCTCVGISNYWSTSFSELSSLSDNSRQFDIFSLPADRGLWGKLINSRLACWQLNQSGSVLAIFVSDLNQVMLGSLKVKL